LHVNIAIAAKFARVLPEERHQFDGHFQEAARKRVEVEFSSPKRRTSLGVEGGV
jgi:hypothetical protein